MTATEKREKIAAMKALAAEYDRRGDVVLRDQMRRSIEDARASWVPKNPAAQALGRLGKGKAKAITEAERERRRERMAVARGKRWVEERTTAEKVSRGGAEARR